MDSHHQRLWDVQTTLAQLSISPKHLTVITIDNPSANAPYHNAGHSCTVALNCLSGATHYALPQKDMRLIFLAGLYHDYDHTQGECTDDVNIARAIRGMRYWCRELDGMDEQSIVSMENMIRATIVPASLFTSERSLCQSIICDADHMQYLEPDAKTFMAGLEKEMGIPVTDDSTSIFLSQYKARTDWGQQQLQGYFASGI